MRSSCPTVMGSKDPGMTAIRMRLSTPDPGLIKRIWALDLGRRPAFSGGKIIPTGESLRRSAAPVRESRSLGFVRGYRGSK